MFEKRWISKKKKTEYEHIDGVPDFITELLAGRGVEGEEAVMSFLYPTVDRLTDPFLLPDMDRAVERILAACDNEEHITIFGDYDADGITSTAVLYHFFKNYLGADVDYYIPNRLTEGYGLSESAIDTIENRGTSLIVTVDCGIACIDEIKYAMQKDIDVVVTDHHKCGDILPDCSAAVNPMRPDSRFPFEALAGCGVAFKLVEAIAVMIGLGEEVLEYLPIVAVGTIGDSMPLVSENRIIASNGLKMLGGTSWMGLSALLGSISKAKSFDVEISASSVMFNVVPRLNAAGRMGDAECALQLLLCEDFDEATLLAEELGKKNAERQKVEQAIVEEALKAENLKTRENDSIVVSLGYEWHHGVIGIVAAKLSEKYSKPAIVLSCCIDECTDGIISARGSARSVPGFNLYAALSENADLLMRFGGHEMAAGLTIEVDKISEFIQGVNRYAERNEIEQTVVQSYEIDAVLAPNMITLENAEAVAMLEPFGQGNPCPVFCTSGFNDVYASKVGDGGKHLKLRLIYENDGARYGADGISFNDGNYYAIAAGIENCSCLYHMEINEWQGKRAPSLKITDIIDSYYPTDETYYNSYSVGEEYYTGTCFTVDHKELAAYFKVLKSFGERFGFSDLFRARKILKDNGYDFSWFMLRRGLDVFIELGFLIKTSGGIYEFNKDSQNRSLEDSAVYRELKRS
ncbi:MAG: single-stranded-DNA-specific exonuclease RecJ [Ruminococcaceae bacterium]|nr:single-stranded-DNA-specific exonuclease RecJ [Oscillospiraceae bacterium]